MSALSTFNCNGCGKSYTLKPEIAGRKVKCKCGTSMVAPPMPVVEEDVYDVVDDPPKATVAPPKVAVAAPASRSKSTSAAVPVAQPVAEVVAKPKRHIEYRRGLSQKERERNASPVEMVRDVISPLVLLMIGLLGLIGVMAFGYADGSTGALAVTMIFVAVYALIKTVVMVGAAFVAAPIAGVSFGPTFWTVMLKLSAIALAPEAVDAAVDLASGGLFGFTISMTVVGLCYLVLFCWLFSLELDDSWLVVRIMIAVRLVIELALWFGLMALVR